MSMDYDYLFKIVVIGSPAVGKTSIIRKFNDNSYSPVYGATIGVDFIIKNVNVQSKNVKLQIWDTAGQERFKAITTTYYKNASAIIVVYDVTDSASFQSLPDWLVDLERYSGENVIKCLVGNKSDRNDRQVSFQMAHDFAKGHQMEYMETSAITSQNINQLFTNLAEELTTAAKLDSTNSRMHPSTKDIVIGRGGSHPDDSSQSCCVIS